MSTKNDIDRGNDPLAPHRHTESGYRIGVLLAVVAVLLLAIGIANTPWFLAQERVGWTRAATKKGPVQFETAPPPPTGYERVPTVSSGSEPSASGSEGLKRDSLQVSSDERPALPMTPVPPGEIVLNTAETMPAVKGGLSNYYLRIDYPEAAVRQNIQGRLTLDFYVTQDGNPRNIRLYEPLHPLLDSAAVRALRKTLFIPGRQNGRPVAVRMRLPVRFQLVERPVEADSTLPRRELP